MKYALVFEDYSTMFIILKSFLNGYSSNKTLSKYNHKCRARIPPKIPIIPKNLICP